MEKLDKILNRILFYFILFLFLVKNTVLINSTVSNIVFACIILAFSAFYFIFYKLYNLKVFNLLFVFLFGLILLQGLFLTYHYHFSYYKYSYDIFRYITFIGLFAFGRYAVGNISLKGISLWFLVLLLYHIITGYLSLIVGDITIMHENLRLSGNFENIGQFGLLMGLSIILLFIMFKNTDNIVYKGIIFMLLVLTVALLSFNNTMRVFASLVFAFFIYYILLKRKFAYLIVIIGIIAGFLLINKEASQRLIVMFSSNYDITELNGVKLSSSLQWRVMQWYLLLKDWSQNYLIKGVGLGQQTVLHGFIAPWGEPFVAHSDFVKLLVESGLIGFPVILFLYIAFFRMSIRQCLKSEYMLVFLYMLFCLLTGNTLFSNPFQIYIFLTGYFTGTYLWNDSKSSTDALQQQH